MRVLEWQLLSKQGLPDGGEDLVVVTPHFAAVIDGATPKGDLTFGDGKNSGAFAAAMVGEAIRTLSADATARQMTDAATQALYAVYERKHLVVQLQHAAYQRPTASVVVYSAHRREVWAVGDCACRLGDAVHTHEKAVDQVLAAARALAIEMALAEGTPLEDLAQTDVGRQFILPLLRKQSLLQNRTTGAPFDYCVIDGFAVPDHGIVVHPVPAGLAELVLASDGYPVVAPTLAEAEATLQQYLAADPQCFRYLRGTKGIAAGQVSFDDRAYLRLAI